MSDEKTGICRQWRKPKIKVYAFSFALRFAANRQNVV